MDSLNIFNELSELVTVRINSCSEVEHPNSWIERRQYKDYDLWCIQEGQVEIRIQDEVHIASKGDLILFSPKVAYTATTPSESCTFIFTHFDVSLGDHLRILDNFQLAGIFKNELVKEEHYLFLNAYDQYKRNAAMSQMRLKGALTILIAKIMEQYSRHQYRGKFIQNATDQKLTKYLDKLQPVFDYAHEHLHQTLTVGELANIASMSEKYFISYFKQALGVTPGRYTYQLKMNRARELLYSKQYSVQEIASMLGYPDPYSFSKAFKKYYQSKFVW
ncbi:AraC family transcriptional regulator [Gracilibacillus caseinilyticus]|uniref:AraC family transcriptional regulator n=1 Tax=Gracilibacillus caseinilyticus TaxID=2932256 RepID=A0ABY4EWG4_9BACI|nr:AraC family transcriptional regulator [Gracilibacillus caseinilyticus]UOQ48756.1 AraC family transcriptional regulator [Gracilibacillus caseinilyticus]